MTDVATQEERPGVLAEIRSDAFRQQLAAALPEGISADRFQRLAITALLDDQIRQRDPQKQLLACDRASLYQAIIKCAQDGLSPDGREAALVKRGDKVVYQPMVGGLRKIAATYGWTIRSAAVRAADEFDFTEEPPSLYHKVFVGGERGELTYAYAVARHADGRREQRVMTRDEVLKRAESATTQQVWDKWPDEMWAKTPARDLFQELPLAPGLAARIAQAVDAAALEPGEAANILYQSSASPGAEAPATGPSEAQAGPAKDGVADQPAQASAAPLPSTDDEPGPSEPPAEQVPPTGQERAEALAAEAAKFVPPSGKYGEGGQYGPKSLGEILALGDDGERWLKWALERISEPPVYAQALAAFARVFAPALWQEAAAKREAQA